LESLATFLTASLEILGIRMFEQNYQTAINKNYSQAYEPWSKEDDEKLATLFRQAKQLRS
jgi:hypothetical protein